MLLGNHSWGLLGLAFLALASQATAQTPDDELGPAMSDQLGAAAHKEAGSTTWSARLGFFDRSDSGGAKGNPFLDESLTVVEPVIIYDHQVSEDFGYDLKLSYDWVSSASIERLNKFDGQSGASGDNYVGLDAGFRHKLSNADNVSWHVGLSSEYDYFSLGLGSGWSHTFEERDAVFSANLNGFYDLVKPIRFDGTEDSDESRTSIAGTLGWYQVLTPTTHGELGLTYSAQSGFLETAYNAVVVEDPAAPPNPNLANNAKGVEFTEELPNTRNRLAIFGRVRHQLGEHDAIELGSRLYNDDWGIGAYDVTPRYLHEFESGLLLDLKYRFYTQTAADAYAEHFFSLPTERTQDSDLGKFDSSLFGAHLSWDTWDAGINFLSRSDGLDHIFFSIGWTKSY
jgi:hypothetical protein